MHVSLAPVDPRQGQRSCNSDVSTPKKKKAIENSHGRNTSFNGGWKCQSCGGNPWCEIMNWFTLRLTALKANEECKQDDRCRVLAFGVVRGMRVYQNVFQKFVGHCRCRGCLHRRYKYPKREQSMPTAYAPHTSARIREISIQRRTMFMIPYSFQPANRWQEHRCLSV